MYIFLRTWVRLPSPPPVISFEEMTGKPPFLNEKINMFYVYYLRSQSFPGKTYIGFTRNLKQRLSDHNSGKSIYTKDYKPWDLIGFLAFDQEAKALRFEQYLKTNAGRVFLRRYFSNSFVLPK